MKKILIAIAAVACIAGCGVDMHQWALMSDVTKVEVGLRAGSSADAVTTITNRDDIVSFLNAFHFRSERDLTVKHPLPGQVTLWSGTNRASHGSFEGRMFRWNKREWTLSKKTASMLSEALNSKGSNKPSAPYQ